MAVWYWPSMPLLKKIYSLTNAFTAAVDTGEFFCVSKTMVADFPLSYVASSIEEGRVFRKVATR